MNETDRLAANLNRFVTEQLILDSSREIGNDDELLLDGIIDSLGATRLVGFIEDEFDVRVPPQDVTVENFGTINAIAAYVSRLSSEGTEAL